MHTCPSCKSNAIHKSRTRTIWGRLRKEITGRRPYRCFVCGWRGWGLDCGPTFGSEETDLAMRAMAPDPPNLKGTALAREDQTILLDLKQLDVPPVKRSNP